MKCKIVLFSSFLLFSLITHAQVVLRESFDTWTTPTNWTNTAIFGGPWEFSTNAGWGVADIPDHTGNGGNYAWVDFSSHDTTVVLTSPSVAVTSLTTPYLEFAYESHTPPHPDYIGAHNLLMVEAWNGASWINVANLQGNTPKGWDLIGYNLTGFTYSNGDSVRIRFVAESGGYLYDYRNDLLIDDVTIKEIPSCFTPTQTMANNISYNSATINWLQVGTPSSWEIAYGAPNTPPSSRTIAVATASPFNLTGLVGNTEYEVYVRAICAAGDTSAWTSAISFKTPCRPVTPSYSHDFTVFLDACWVEATGRLRNSSNTKLNYGTSNWKRDGFRNIGRTGAASVNISGRNTKEWLISRSIDLGTTATNYQLEFDIALTAWNNSSVSHMGTDDTLAVVISTDNGVTWGKANILKVFTSTNEPSNTGDRVVVNLSAYTGVVKFGFYAASSVSNRYYGIHIDNFAINTLQSCAAVSRVTSANITASSATIAWTENGTATQWQLEYGPSGFTLGTGTKASATANPTTITNLTDNTAYQVYVRAICAAGDTSLWSQVRGFRTLCGPATPPYTYDFTNYLGFCWMESAGRLTTATTLNNAASRWRKDGFRNMGRTGAATVNIYGTDSDEWLISRSIDLGTAATNYQLEFDIALTNYSTAYPDSMGVDDTLAVVISTDNGATWSKTNILKAFTKANQPSNAGDRVVIDLSAYTGVVRFGFYAASSVRNKDYDIHIDNFAINTLQTCLSPSRITSTNITPNTADIAWVENGTATQWQLEYGPSGFTLGTGTKAIATTNPTTITNLIGDTNYEVYVRAICAAGDTSLWSQAGTFRTLCGPATPPYTYDFANYLGTCWMEATGRLATATTLNPTASTWKKNGYRNIGRTGAASVNIYGRNVDEWLISRSIDLGTTATNYQLEFDIALTNYNNSSLDSMGVDDTLAVVISTDNGATWSKTNILKVFTKANEPLNSGDRIVIDLSAYTGMVRFGFYAASSVRNTDYDIHIDNFEIDTLQSCPTPSRITSTNITPNTADIAWVENGSATQWQLEYGPSGFTLGTGTQTTATVNAVTITNLIDETAYDIYVRSICSPGDTSSWSYRRTFRTPCGPSVPTYTYDFANYLGYCWTEATGRLANNTTLTGVSSRWKKDGYRNVGGTGAASVNIFDVTKEWLISKSIDLGTATTNYQLEFDIALTNFSNSSLDSMGVDDTLAVVISTDNGATWSKTNILKAFTKANEPSNVGDRVVIDLSAYTGVVKFGFYAASSIRNTDYDIHIDNFEVKPAPPRFEDLVINEIMYNSPESGTDSLEFIEIYNSGPTIVDLNNMSFTAGITYNFPATSLNPGGYYLIAANGTAFNNAYGIAPNGVYTGELSNSGEIILLADPTGNIVDSVRYDTSGVWSAGLANGQGASLVLCSPNMDNANGANWYASTTALGITINGKNILASPGTSNSCTPTVDVAVANLSTDSIYCNTNTTNRVFVVTNNSNATTNAITYTVTLNQSPIDTGTIPALSANASDTISVSSISLTSGVNIIQTAINTTGDIDSTNNTIRQAIYVSNISTSIAPTTTIGCHGDSTGAVVATTTNAYGTSTYLWNTGNNSDSINNLTAGTYMITATDSIGCTATAVYTMSEPSILTMSITNNNNSDSATAVPTGGTSPYTYLWSDSNSQNTATAINLVNGITYTVTVTDANGCTLTDSIDISFIKVATVNKTNSLTIFPNPTSGQAIAELNLATTTNVQINITNALGQLVSRQALGNVQNKRIELSTQDLPDGLYLIQFQLGKKQITRKLVVQRK